ncbi:hypothetical protein Tco_0196619, partial [Tanacetum coccineum]
MVAFLGSLQVPLQHNEWMPSYADNSKRKVKGDGAWHLKCSIVDPYGNEYNQGGNHDDKARSSLPKRTCAYEIVEDAMLPCIDHDFLSWDGCNRATKTKYNTKLANLLPKKFYSTSIINWLLLNTMGCAKEIEEMLEIMLVEIGGDEEIFTSKAWRHAFYISKPIYTKLCHKFYSTFEFDEEVPSEELWSNRLIKFRLVGKDHSLTLVQFAKHLGLYFNDEVGELHLSRSQASTIRKPILKVLQKMISYSLCQRTNGHDKMQNNDLWLLSMFEAKNQNGYANVAWVIAKWMKKKGIGRQRESMICCSQFITRMTRRTNLLSDEVLNGLSAPTYCKTLDKITLRELIRLDRRLIPKVLVPGAPRVVMPILPRHSMKDLYDRLGSIQIRQGAMKRMAYRGTITHLVMISSSISSTTSSTSSNIKDMMTSSVEMTR